MGKIVQRAKEKIFRNRKRNKAIAEFKNSTMSEGLKYISPDNDDYKRMLEEVVDAYLDKKDLVDENFLKLLSPGASETLNEIEKTLEKVINTHLTVLPKRIKTRGLIITIAANQPSEYFAVDISQLESRGIAHMITARTESHEQLAEMYEAEQGIDDDEEWQEVLEEVREGNDLISVYLPGATLLYYEDFDYWDYEEAEE